MSLRVLLDENIEHEVLARLEALGHDVEHVDTSSTLGKGDTDPTMAVYSIEYNRIIVTYDDHFVTDVPPSEYDCVLFVEDRTVVADDISQAIHAMSEAYPVENFTDCKKVAVNGCDRCSLLGDPVPFSS